MAAESYMIREAGAHEQPTLLKFLEQHFFHREFVNKVYLRRNKHRIDDVEEKKIIQDIKNKYNVAVSNLPGLVIVHNETKEIVGINLMLIEENPNFSELKSFYKIYAEKLSSVPWTSKILDELATYVLKPLNTSSISIFSKFPLHRRALKLLFLCVNPEHSGQGLATKLVRESVKYAESKNIGIVYGLFMSEFSQKAAMKNGFQNISGFDILDLRDIDGNALFEGEKSHTVLTMAKEVEIDNSPARSVILPDT